MTFLKECVSLFGSKDLYQVLKLDRSNNSLSSAQIKKAYYHQSILWHPDRFASSQHDEATRELAKQKFQVIGRAYAILGDAKKRKVYDEAGLLDDEDEFDESTDWTSLWRGVFKKVTPEDIAAYLTKFRGSQEEIDEVKNAYQKHKGNMDLIMESVVGAEHPDEDRIREIVRHCIECGELIAYARFTNEPPAARLRRAKRARHEAVQAEQALKEMCQRESGDASGEGLDEGSNGLSALIRAKQRKRSEQSDEFLEKLAQKYGGPSSKKNRKGYELMDEFMENSAKKHGGSPSKKKRKGPEKTDEFLENLAQKYGGSSSKKNRKGSK